MTDADTERNALETACGLGVTDMFARMQLGSGAQEAELPLETYTYSPRVMHHLNQQIQNRLAGRAQTTLNIPFNQNRRLKGEQPKPFNA